MKRIFASLIIFLLLPGILFASSKEPGFWVLSDFSKGLNSHISDVNTPDNQAQEAKNVRFNDRFGALSKRDALITVWDAGSASINALHRYYKSDGTNKTIIATSTYLDIGDVSATTTTHIASGLTDGKRWQFATFKDIAIGGNGYDQPIKYDGKTLTTANTDAARTAGELCAELGAPFAELNTGTDLTASKWYMYKMMFEDSSGVYYSTARSNPILTGAAVYNIYLTDIPIGPVGTTARYIYRTSGGANQATVEADTSYYLCATISDNTTRVYADAMSDATLVGETAWSTSGKFNCTPPKGKYLAIHKERLWVSGNTTYKSDVYFSDDGNPDFFDTDSFDVIRADDGDEVTFIKTFLGILTVGKTNTIQKFYTDGSTTTDWYVSDPFSFIGCPAPYTVATSPIGILYLGRNGLYRFDGQSSHLMSDSVTPDIEDISQVDFVECSGIFHSNEYRLAYSSSSSGGSYNNRVLIYNLARDAYTIDTENINCWLGLNSGTDFGGLYSGSSSGDGYVLAHTFTASAVIKRYKSEIDAGVFDDTRSIGTEDIPEIELAWDCTIAGWLTELQTKDVNITNIGNIVTYLPNAIIARPDTDGTWTSPVYEISAQKLDKIYWNKSLAPFGDVTFQVRLDSDTDMTGISWNTAVTNPNGSDISGITSNTYIQVRANLSTTNIDYSPKISQVDGYVFRLLYSKIGAVNETSVLSLYKTGWKNFGVAGYKKMIRRIKVFYEGTSGTVSFNIKADDGDIDKTFTIDLSVAPEFSTTDVYTGEGNLKVYTFLPPMNSATEPSLISQLFQFLITENGTTGWKITRVEVEFEVEELYD